MQLECYFISYAFRKFFLPSLRPILHVNRVDIQLHLAVVRLVSHTGGPKCRIMNSVGCLRGTLSLSWNTLKLKFPVGVESSCCERAVPGILYF